jgi:hypothetical protein
VDLPTYTNIWRIEKRLYKLYDFRLPMPLPLGQIAVFTAIAVPYVVVLAVLGLPFSHTLLWLYVLPPAVLAWFATRPVLESKRLPELVASQLRYLNEPRTWCRMAPLTEQDEVVVTARVWRRAAGLERVERGDRVPLDALAELDALAGRDGQVELEPRDAGADREERVKRQERDVEPAVPRPAVPKPAVSRPAAAAALPPGRDATPGRWPVLRSAPRLATVTQQPEPDVAQPVRAAAPPVRQPEPVRDADPRVPADRPRVPADRPRVPADRPRVPADRPPVPAPPAARPIVTVNEDRSAERPVRMVERALGSPAVRRAEGWRDRVVVVPGGHRPGQPDQLQRDRARARLPVTGTRRIVVLGCTVGAGQSVTTLRTGELLASLRDEPVAVLDLNPGQNSLSERARTMPALTEAPKLGQAAEAREARPSRLEVITNQADDASGPAAAKGGPGAVADVAQIFEVLAARYSLTLADPAASAVPRVLQVADQLLLVAPASADAASAIAMTLEWLEAHRHGALAAGAITVLNGVSRKTMTYVEQAEAVAAGRCRAIVRVPWDDQLKNPGVQPPAGLAPVGPEHRPPAGSASASAERAYTALAGVLVASLMAAPQARPAELRRAGP